MSRSFGSRPIWRSPRTTAPHGAVGFTLLELIVVLAIFSVVSLLAYGGLNSVLKSRALVEEALARTVAMQKAYLRLRDDFQQLRDRPVRNAYGTEWEPSLWVTSDRRVEFTRGGWRNPLSHARSTLERVSYRLDEDEHLVRESWRVLDRPPESTPARVELVQKVREMQWRFLDAQNQWQTEWPPGGRQDLAPPLAVELTIDTADWGELTFLFSTQ